LDYGDDEEASSAFP